MSNVMLKSICILKKKIEYKIIQCSSFYRLKDEKWLFVRYFLKGIM